MSLTVDPCWCNSIYHPLPKLISTRTDVWPATFGLWWNTVWENGFCGSARHWAEDSQVHGKGPYGCLGASWWLQHHCWYSCGCGRCYDSSYLLDRALIPHPHPPDTWLLYQYWTGNRSAHPSASAHEVTSLRPEEVSFGRTEASSCLNLSFHELCPLPPHPQPPPIPPWYF